MALANILQMLLSVQALFWPILDVFGQNDLEGQGQMSPYAIPFENFPRYTYKPNLVIVGRFVQKLSSGQAIVDRRTDGQTDGRTDVFMYEQVHNMMQVWPGKLSERQLPVRNPAREGTCTSMSYKDSCI